ncbi:hypothetical protein BGP77_01475 [Saccharospirillum sp. MSK14-1]|nr:hypothetical protein BGP77_01475 [Saccharospirillum sp. MSK14-1]
MVNIQLGGLPEANIYGPPKQQSFLSGDDQNLPGLAERMSKAMDKGPGINNLAQSLTTFLQDDQNSVHQQLDRYTYQNTGGKWVEPDFSELEKHTVHAESELSFSLKTKSGDTITFNLHYEKGLGSTPRYAAVGYENVSVDYELDGRLSQSEKNELLALSDKINALANNYFATGELDLDSLDLGSLNEVAELSLSLDGGLTEITPPFALPNHDDVDYGLRLKFSDGPNARHIESVANGNKVTATLDKLGLVDGYDTERREAALAQYRQQLVDGVGRANGSEEDRKLLLAAFDALHGELEEPKPGLKLSEDEAAMLTSVADFRISYLSRVGMRNPEEGREEQSARFSLDFSQETEIHQYANGDLDIDQNQFWKLRGTYFKPAEGKSMVDFSSNDQNYRYYELQEQAASRTELERRNGVLVKADRSVELDAKLEQLVYKDNVLLEWNTITNQYSDKTNLLALYDDKFAEPEVAMLDDLILNMDAMYKYSDEKITENDPNKAPDYLRGEEPVVFANEAASVKA